MHRWCHQRLLRSGLPNLQRSSQLRFPSNQLRWPSSRRRHQLHRLRLRPRLQRSSPRR
jgi:hypothetical protein